MITNWCRGAGALTLVGVLALALPAFGPPSPARAAGVTTLADAVGKVPVVPEHSGGFTPGAFPHWNAGQDPDDGCDTRGEVLLEEAIEEPRTGAGCVLSGGRWRSNYDGQETTEPGALQVVHTVQLAEAWESGASKWTAARREAYANDQGASTSLTAITARTAKQRGDRDPADWLPPVPAEHCRYIAEWVATKLRWRLDADTDEHEALKVFAEGPCEDTIVQHVTVP
ncbi:HNH endonuclease [Streptomyces sp. NPDC052164]|uniref:HNH endonuclease n=1 Tax=unclassified Streptomyces TaxID=2593676 RepID=UPI00341B14D8